MEFGLSPVTQEGSSRLKKFRKEGSTLFPLRSCAGKRKNLSLERIPAGSGGAAAMSSKISWERSKVWDVGACGQGNFLPVLHTFLSLTPGSTASSLTLVPWLVDFKLSIKLSNLWHPNGLVPSKWNRSTPSWEDDRVT